MKPKAVDTYIEGAQLIDQNEIETACAAHQKHDDEVRKWFEEQDPEQMIVNFCFEDLRCKTIEEEDAKHAHESILLAKQRIKELRRQIEEQEELIMTAQSVIKNYKRSTREDSLVGPGRPIRSEYRESIVRKFVGMWVRSLKEALEVKGCGAKAGLEMMVSSSQERNWRRWLNGDAIPSYSTFDDLLDARITSGKYAGKMLCDVPVSPTHHQILTLLQFI